MFEINKFSGEFRYLSNFFKSKFVDNGQTEWQTVEHYFQAAKTTNPFWKTIIWEAPTPAIAKQMGRQAPLISTWDSIKVDVMRDALKYKFDQNSDLKEKLMSLKDIYLEEGNTWHDNLWGNCTCSKCKKVTGQNLLGNLLMTLRDDYLKKENYE